MVLQVTTAASEPHATRLFFMVRNRALTFILSWTLNLRRRLSKVTLCHVWLWNRVPLSFVRQQCRFSQSADVYSRALLIRDRTIDVSEHREILCKKEKGKQGFDSRTWRDKAVDVVGLLDLFPKMRDPNYVLRWEGEGGSSRANTKKIIFH